MRIRLMTFHTPKNYGAVLQAFSLMSYLKNFSDDVKVIDYNTPQLRAKYPIKNKTKGLKSLVKNVLVMHTYGDKAKMHQKFENFVCECLNLTCRYESYAELESDSPKADVLVTGSDQVFNPMRIPEERKAFYLDFAKDSVRRISYAASFGVDKIPEEKKGEIARYLNCFDKISVREDSGIKIVEELSGKSATTVLDPVFLNDKEFWNAVSKKHKKAPEKYLLYYRLLGSRKSDLAAKRIAKDKGLKLVTVSSLYLRMALGKVLWDVGPREFLDLYSNADFVVTDSFHGVAFSVIYKKQFVFTDTNPLTKERGYNLIEKLSLEKQAYLDTYNSGESIDYEKVDELLLPLIEESKTYLEKALKD